MSALLNDIRFAFRVLFKDRALTIVAILTLSLGIAAPVTWYSVLDKVVFKPLPFAELDRLVVLNERHAQSGRQTKAMAVGDFNDLRNESSSYDPLAAYEPTDLYLTGVTEPVKIEGAFVTASFFKTLGVSPALGRTFLPEEEQPGRDAVLILSDRLWRQSFASDPNILGRGIFVNDKEHIVIGVMPPDFDYPITVRGWVPLSLTDKDVANRTDRYVAVIGKLKGNVSAADAQAEADVLMSRIEQRNPETNLARRARVVSLPLQVRGDFSGWFSAMCFAMSLFVLVLCCVNITTIQLARGWARQKELTLRAAVGASRWTIMRQLLTESILLSLLGSIPAVLIAFVSVTVIRNRVPPDFARFIPGWYSVSVDGRVLAFALLITIVAGIVFGLIPALRASKIDLTQVLKEHGGGSGFKRHRVLKSLLVVEVAVAIAALAGAGSLLEGFLLLPNKYRALNPENVLTMQISAMDWTEDKHRAVNSLHRMLQGIDSLPGVQGAALASNVPGSIEGSATRFIIKDAENSVGALPRSALQVVSPEFFNTFNIQILKGRGFGNEDTLDSRPAAIITQKLAQRFFQDRDPIQQEIKLGPPTSKEPWLTIVGVVADINGFWFEPEPQPMIYLSHQQNPRRTTFLTVRSSNDPLAIVGAVSNEVRMTDKNIAISHIKPLNEVITEQLSGVRVAADFSIGLVLTALLLSLAGVYGMSSFTVTQRTREIGVRMALGARQRDVRMMTIKNALKLAMIGVAVGLPLSLALSIWMASFLWGVGSFNVITLLGQILLLVIVGIMGSYIPAKRASSIEPVQALRHE
jgi:putative ABC transport system permease protein